VRVKLILAALAALAIVTPANADDCNKPLKMLASLPLTTLSGDDRVTLPVTINGVPKQFLFDTGGLLPQISSTVVDELKLTRLDSAMTFYSVDGTVSNKYAVIDKFGLGNIPGVRAELQISTDSRLDGLFSPVVYKALDFDMDFAAGKLNLMLGDHCEGKVVYWPAKALAVVPITIDNYHIRVPVTVDGHNLMAIIDTGASTSTVSLEIATRVMNLTPESDGIKVIGHLGSDETALVYAYPFKTLTFEGITVKNPQIRILTDIVNKNADHRKETGSLIKSASDSLTLPDVIVGMDVLRQLHVYLALTEKRLYLTEATAAASAPAP
jgi:hypothetical protein